MTDQEFNERAAAIEQRIGRKPTQSEVMRNDLDRPDTRTVRDRVFAEARRTVPMATGDPIEEKLKAEIDKLRRDTEWREYVKSNQSERLIADYTKILDDRAEAAEASKVLSAHLRNMESDLAPLRQLRETMRWNPEYSVEQIEQLEYVVRIGETPNHDSHTFRKFRDDVLGAENDRIDKVRFDRAAKIAALQNEIEQLERARPQRIAEPEPTPDEKLEALRAKNVRRAEIRKAHYAEVNRLVDERKYDEAEALSDRGPDYGEVA